MWSHIGVKEDLEMKKCDGGLSNLGLVKVLLKKRPLRWKKKWRRLEEIAGVWKGLFCWGATLTKPTGKKGFGCFNAKAAQLFRVEFRGKRAIMVGDSVVLGAGISPTQSIWSANNTERLTCGYTVPRSQVMDKSRSPKCIAQSLGRTKERKWSLSGL